VAGGVGGDGLKELEAAVGAGEVDRDGGLAQMCERVLVLRGGRGGGSEYRCGEERSNERPPFICVGGREGG
jgi:hypothetical protein